MTDRIPFNWWLICEACLRPFSGDPVYCTKCDMRVIQCGGCMPEHKHSNEVPDALRARLGLLDKDFDVPED